MVDDCWCGARRRRGRNSGDDRAPARSDKQSSHRRRIRFRRSVDRFRCRRPRPPVHVTDGFVAARGLRCRATIGARGARLRHRCRDRRRPRRRGQHSVKHWLRTRSVSPDSRAYRCDGILGRRRCARRRDPREPDRVGLARGTTLARRSASNESSPIASTPSRSSFGVTSAALPGRGLGPHCRVHRILVLSCPGIIAGNVWIRNRFDVNPIRTNLIANANAEYHRTRTIDRGSTHQHLRCAGTSSRVLGGEVRNPEPPNDVRESVRRIARACL